MEFSKLLEYFGTSVAVLVVFLPLLKFSHELLVSKRQAKVKSLELLSQSFEK